MKLLTVASAALNQTPLDWEGNARRIVQAISTARKAGVSVLCLPELAVTGYGCEDAFLSPGVQTTALSFLETLVPETKGLIVGIGVPLFHRSSLYNAVCVVADGRICGFVVKHHLPLDGIYYEPRWFKPWQEGRHETIEISGTSYPIGDLLFDFSGIRVGVEICEDAWVASRPGRHLSAQGVDVILNPSASHFAFDRFDIRKRFVIEGSRAFNTAYLYANLLGNEAGRVIYDGTSLIASDGKLIATGRRFSFEEVVVTACTVDLDVNRLRASQGAASEDDSSQEVYQLVKQSFNWPETEKNLKPAQPPAWESSPQLKEQEFTRSVSLGLLDYLRKSGAQGFAVSLSGGADSSGTVCLVASAVRLALDEVGLDGLKRMLVGIPGVQSAANEQEVLRVLLTCVYQSTRNSSERTQSAARELAEALHSTYYSIDVDPLVQSYTDLVQDAIGQKLTWEKHDISLQNIQARVRGPMIWYIANLKRALLLATSNRSEAAVGYTTMDGDTCGGLSPIAGIDKAFLLEWLRWLEKGGLKELGPLTALAAVNAGEPTAELRPAESNQTDESDLMPYVVLDRIERLAIRDKKTPKEVIRLIREEYTTYPDQQLDAWVRRFFALWCGNQWKRERYAPSFHLDDENLDPKTWCRFPILSGGYRWELSQLK